MCLKSIRNVPTYFYNSKRVLRILNHVFKQYIESSRLSNGEFLKGMYVTFLTFTEV